MSEPKKDNMELWNAVCVTDPDVTKKVVINNVPKYTAICAQSQIKRATELWGSIGRHWAVREEKYEILDGYCIYTGQLHYPNGVISIHADIEIIFSFGKWKGRFNDDFTKKVATDALTKGLSLLGFNADIFEGKFDDNKYVAELKAQKKTDGKKNQQKKELIHDPDRQTIVNEIVSILTDKVFTNEDREKVKTEIEATKKGKSLSDSIISLKALRDTYQADQNERIEGFEGYDIPGDGELTEEQEAKELADRKQLEEPDIF
ncbi:MAG TPA: hypothetical protein ENH82_17760 [bacterium]|nr:hypothetical protein [bacterium]